MSGSGSSGLGGIAGGVGGAASPESSERNCASLNARTVLNSPVPGVMETLAPGDVLNVELRDSSGKPLVAAVTEDGDVAGSLTPEIIAQLIACVGEGYEYVAVVQQIRGGYCVVQIRPKS